MSSRVIQQAVKLNVRAFSQGASKTPTTSTPASACAPKTSINTNVPGLSQNIVLPRSQPLGPGAATDGAYKVPEYFCYNRTSYYEAEVEMAKYRLPQPSALKK